MTSVSLPTKRLAAMLCTTGLMLAAGAAHAQSGNADSSQSRYQQDVAACKSGTTGQPLDTCLREAGAARQERNRQNLLACSLAHQVWRIKNARHGRRRNPRLSGNIKNRNPVAAIFHGIENVL